MKKKRNFVFLRPIVRQGIGMMAALAMVVAKQREMSPRNRLIT